jgi:hypothetical protein
MRGHIPSAPLIPIVREYLDRRQGGEAVLEALAESVGFTPTSLYHFLQGHTQEIGFDRADQLLCIIGRVDLWYVEPLREHYYAADLADPLELPSNLHGKCKHGHERTTDNTTVLSNGTLRCRDCSRKRSQECRDRQRAARMKEAA